MTLLLLVRLGPVYLERNQDDYGFVRKEIGCEYLLLALIILAHFLRLQRGDFLCVAFFYIVQRDVGEQWEFADEAKIDLHPAKLQLLEPAKAAKGLVYRWIHVVDICVDPEVLKCRCPRAQALAHCVCRRSEGAADARAGRGRMSSHCYRPMVRMSLRWLTRSVSSGQSWRFLTGLGSTQRPAAQRTLPNRPPANGDLGMTPTRCFGALATFRQVENLRHTTSLYLGIVG